MSKKILWTMLLTVAMLGSVWADEEEAEPVNLALGAKATASSTEAGDNIKDGGKPSLAVDGKLDTRWGSEHRIDPSWITLDLGTAKTFQTVRLYWEGSYAKEYDLEASDDGKTWKKIYEQKEGNGKLENITLEQPMTTRYFRLLGKKRATQWGYSLWEIQLFAE